MSLLGDLRARLFPKGPRRALRKTWSRVFSRTGKEQLVQALAALDLAPGAVICVHSQLSALACEPSSRSAGPSTAAADRPFDS